MELGTTVNPGACPAVAGRYVLLVCLSQPTQIRVRSGRNFSLSEGTYAYVGSASGPGGLAARLNGYLQRRCRLHWHIDFLLASARPTWSLCFDTSVAECDIANALGRMSGSSPVPEFGCSDCHCRTHLYRLGAYGAISEVLADLLAQAPELTQAFLAQVQLS